MNQARLKLEGNILDVPQGNLHAEHRRVQLEDVVHADLDHEGSFSSLRCLEIAALFISPSSMSPKRSSRL